MPRATAGGPPGVRLGIGLVIVIALVFLPRTAAAHTLGLSTSEFDVLPDGRVEARLTFATAELAGSAGIDSDHDGVVTESEVARAGDDLSAFLAGGVGVDAGSAPCPATFLGASLSDIDGLVLQARYACPTDAERIEVTLYYLSALPRGHREIVRVVGAGAMVEAVLTGDHRALALPLPNGPSGRPSPWRARRPLVLGALLASSMLAFVFFRRRAARRKPPSHVESTVP